MPAERSTRAWLAALAVAVLAIGAAVAARPDPADRNQSPTPPPSSIAASSQPVAPAFIPAADAIAAAATSEGKRSARTQLSLPREPGVWPGTNGLSGVNGYPVLNSASVRTFCTGRGRACNVAQTYTDRSTYESMTRGTGWTFEFFADFDGVLVVSQGLVPDGGEDLLGDCAAGDYDAHWRDFGSLMVENGRGDSVVRLGWEMNESTMGWRGLNTADYLACYRRAADALRSTNPAVVLDWTINAHNSPAALCGGLSTNCYPGDAYADIIGIDNYDHHPWSPTKADFDRTAARPEGLDWLFAFAQQHGKLFSVGEWGIMPTADAGRDNPDFISWMHDWFAAHATHLAYEAYFQRCDGTASQSSILRPADPKCLPNTASSSRYRSLYTP
ncbi:glycoside hydrolase family 26 protein [Actinoplanes sp. GCM10030250]|uniref:glycoside hydrolase family 26 protein n=1 Tax=Actinoplanes sp. GCM10030250 TaxID=3273376 RepID=UPI003611E769